MPAMGKKICSYLGSSREGEKPRKRTKGGGRSQRSSDYFIVTSGQKTSQGKSSVKRGKAKVEFGTPSFGLNEEKGSQGRRE